MGLGGIGVTTGLIVSVMAPAGPVRSVRVTVGSVKKVRTNTGPVTGVGAATVLFVGSGAATGLYLWACCISLRWNFFLFLIAIYETDTGSVAGAIAVLTMKVGVTLGSVTMLRATTEPVAGIGVPAESVIGVGESAVLSSDSEVFSTP